jgi:hypothetical protein
MLSYVARASLQLPKVTRGRGRRDGRKRMGWDGRGGIEGEGKEWLAEGRRNDS